MVEKYKIRDDLGVGYSTRVVRFVWKEVVAYGGTLTSVNGCDVSNRHSIRKSTSR